MNDAGDYFIKRATRAIWQDLTPSEKARIRAQLLELKPAEQLALVTDVDMESYREPESPKITAAPREKPVRNYQEEHARYLGETIN